MTLFALRPSSVPSLTWARRMSPVEMCGSWKSSRSRSAWVPLPAPGGPSRIRFISDKTEAAYPLARGLCQRPGACSARTGSAALLEEALVTSHHQLRLELLHGFERDADHDQDRGAAEEEVLVGARYQDRWQRGDGGEEQRAGERQASEDAVEEFGGRAPRAHAGDEAAVLLQVV